MTVVDIRNKSKIELYIFIFHAFLIVNPLQQLLEILSEIHFLEEEK